MNTVIVVFKFHSTVEQCYDTKLSRCQIKHRTDHNNEKIQNNPYSENVKR